MINRRRQLDEQARSAKRQNMFRGCLIRVLSSTGLTLRVSPLRQLTASCKADSARTTCHFRKEMKKWAVSESVKCHNLLENHYYCISCRFCVYGFPNKSVQQFMGSVHSRGRSYPQPRPPATKGSGRGYG